MLNPLLTYALEVYLCGGNPTTHSPSLTIGSSHSGYATTPVPTAFWRSHRPSGEKFLRLHGSNTTQVLSDRTSQVPVKYSWMLSIDEFKDSHPNDSCRKSLPIPRDETSNVKLHFPNNHREAKKTIGKIHICMYTIDIHI